MKCDKCHEEHTTIRCPNRYDFKKYVAARCEDAIDMYVEYIEKHGEEDPKVAKAKAVDEIRQGMDAEEELERQGKGDPLPGEEAKWPENRELA